MAVHNEIFFTAKLANFNYHANTTGALLARLQDLEASYDNSSVVQPSAKLVERVPNCGSRNHEHLVLGIIENDTLPRHVQIQIERNIFQSL